MTVVMVVVVKGSEIQVLQVTVTFITLVREASIRYCWVVREAEGTGEAVVVVVVVVVRVTEEVFEQLTRCLAVIALLLR